METVVLPMPIQFQIIFEIRLEPNCRMLIPESLQCSALLFILLQTPNSDKNWQISCPSVCHSHSITGQIYYCLWVCDDANQFRDCPAQLQLLVGLYDAQCL